jgi:hypothetical protein
MLCHDRVVLHSLSSLWSVPGVQCLIGQTVQVRLGKKYMRGEVARIYSCKQERGIR